MEEHGLISDTVWRAMERVAADVNTSPVGYYDCGDRVERDEMIVLNALPDILRSLRGANFTDARSTMFREGKAR